MREIFGLQLAGGNDFRIAEPEIETTVEIEHDLGMVGSNRKLRPSGGEGDGTEGDEKQALDHGRGWGSSGIQARGRTLGSLKWKQQCFTMDLVPVTWHLFPPHIFSTPANQILPSR